MAKIVALTQLSPTMSEGTLSKWKKNEGDKIVAGDILAEVETDKANMDFPLEEEGTLLKLLVAEGDTVKLGAPVAVLGEPGEDADKALAEAGATAVTAATPVIATEEIKNLRRFMVCLSLRTFYTWKPYLIYCGIR